MCALFHLYFFATDPLHATLCSDVLEQEKQVKLVHKSYARLMHTTPLTKEEELELGRKIFQEKSEAARKVLIEKHMPLVISIASSWAHGSAVLQDDLVSAGTIGLIEAIDTWDIDRDNRFATYAKWWIEQKIRMTAYREKRPATKGSHANEYILRKSTAKLRRKLRREPTHEEVAKDSGKSVTAVRSAFFKEIALTQHSIHEQVHSASGGSESMLGDFIPDQFALMPDALVDAKEQKKILQELVAELLHKLESEKISERNRTIFKIYYNLDGIERTEQPTLEYVAMQYGITRERVRQILVRVWKELDPKKVHSASWQKNPLWIVAAKIELLNEVIAVSER